MPISKIERDENGLVKGLEYKFTEDGAIDWRSMVPVKYLYVNNDPRRRESIEKKYGKKIDQIDIEKDNVSDTELIITLGGLRHLARLRGYTSVDEKVNISSDDYASVTSYISYIPNYETEGSGITWSSSASATLKNTASFYSNYLVEAASNRAFARNVRSFLNINIVCKEELGGANEPEAERPVPSTITGADPLSILKKNVAELNWSFEEFKSQLTKANESNKIANAKADEEGKPGRRKPIIENIDLWKSYEDIPKNMIFSLANRIKEYIELIRKNK